MPNILVDLLVYGRLTMMFWSVDHDIFGHQTMILFRFRSFDHDIWSADQDTLRFVHLTIRPLIYIKQQ